MSQSLASPGSYQEVVGFPPWCSRVVLAANNLPTSLSARPALTSSPAEGGLAAAPVAGAGPWPYLLRTQPPPSVPSRSITARTPLEAVRGVAGGLWWGVVLLGLVRCQVSRTPDPGFTLCRSFYCRVGAVQQGAGGVPTRLLLGRNAGPGRGSLRVRCRS